MKKQVQSLFHLGGCNSMQNLTFAVLLLKLYNLIPTFKETPNKSNWGHFAM